MPASFQQPDQGYYPSQQHRHNGYLSVDTSTSGLQAPSTTDEDGDYEISASSDINTYSENYEPYPPNFQLQGTPNDAAYSVTTYQEPLDAAVDPGDISLNRYKTEEGPWNSAAPSRQNSNTLSEQLLNQLPDNELFVDQNVDQPMLTAGGGYQEYVGLNQQAQANYFDPTAQPSSGGPNENVYLPDLNESLQYQSGGQAPFYPQNIQVPLDAEDTQQPTSNTNLPQHSAQTNLYVCYWQACGKSYATQSLLK